MGQESVSGTRPVVRISYPPEKKSCTTGSPDETPAIEFTGTVTGGFRTADFSQCQVFFQSSANSSDADPVGVDVWEKHWHADLSSLPFSPGVNIFKVWATDAFGFTSATNSRTVDWRCP